MSIQEPGTLARIMSGAYFYVRIERRKSRHRCANSSFGQYRRFGEMPPCLTGGNNLRHFQCPRRFTKKAIPLNTR